MNLFFKRNIYYLKKVKIINKNINTLKKKNFIKKTTFNFRISKKASFSGLKFIKKEIKEKSINTDRHYWYKNLYLNLSDSIEKKNNYFSLGRVLSRDIFKYFGYNNKFINFKRKTTPFFSESIWYILNRNSNNIGSTYKIFLIKRFLYRTSLIMYNNKGIRLIKGLPVNGQRTKTNSNTSKRKNIKLKRESTIFFSTIF